MGAAQPSRFAGVVALAVGGGSGNMRSERLPAP